jgi:nitric oxide reductase subunit B
MAFYDTTLIWQWMRLPGDILFAVAAVLMAWDFLIKLRPLYPRLTARVPGGRMATAKPKPGA